MVVIKHPVSICGIIWVHVTGDGQTYCELIAAEGGDPNVGSVSGLSVKTYLTDTRLAAASALRHLF